ncbi:MAG: zinc ribbon domain-containing protein [Candidatus Thorarchaeota archaeon]|nr:zinc ribbon domain-containing protein [Candidatus Thorarchaeota archaeon]
MKGSQNTLILGFLLVISGAFIIAVTSSTEGGLFYIFPFFFFSASEPSGLLFILLFTVLFVSFALYPLISCSRSRNEQVLYSRRCDYCFEAIPDDSSFCPYCGEIILQGDGLDNDI